MTSLSRWNLATAVLFSAMAGLATTTARPGPDYPAYRDWANAIVRADLDELASSQRSPLGHKLSQWLAGPALPHALPQAASFDSLDVDASMAVMGAIVAAICAGLLANLFGHLSADRATTIFWFAAACVGSPIGYYALAFSSESLAIWLIALLLGVLIAPQRRPHPLVVGSATAMLLMIRPYWVCYAVPTLAGVIRGEFTGTTLRRKVVAGLAIALPILAAVVQLAIVNRWMTGDAWRFVYLFGDAEFQSVDLRHPQWGAVLWHPLHGLLIYHPLVGLGFLAMLVLVFRAPKAGERAAWGALAAIVAINVYIQAAWFCWWQGTGITLGMRGLVPAAVPALAAVARLAQRSPSPAFRHALVLLTTVCGLWSWTLLPPGPTDFVTYSALADGLRAEFDKMLDPRFIFLAMPALFLFCGLAYLFSKHPDDVRPSPVSGTCAAALLTLWVVYVWTQWILGAGFFGWLNPKRDPFLADHSPESQLAIAAAVAIAAGIGVAVGMRFSFDWRRLCHRASTVIVVGSAAIFGVAAYRIEAGPTRIPTRPPTYPGKLYYVTEVWASWDDYQTVPGFDVPKRRLRDFMIREGIPLDVTVVSPVPPPEWTEEDESRHGDGRKSETEN